MFPKKTFSKSCSEYEVDGDMTFGHGVLDISRAHIVLFMGAFVKVCCIIFPSPLLSLIYYGPKH